MEEVQDCSSDMALLAGLPGVSHRQQLLRLQPFLEVINQFLPYVASQDQSAFHRCLIEGKCCRNSATSKQKLHTKGDVEPAGQQVQKPRQASQQGKLELVVICQVDQYRAQARLQP